MTTAYTTISEELASLQGQLLGFDVGGNSEKQQGTMASQLMDAQRKVAELEALAKQSAIKVTHLKGEVKQRKKQAESAKKDYEKLEKGLTSKANELASVDKKLGGLKRDPELRARLEGEIEELQRKTQKSQDRVESARANLSHLVDLQYNARQFGDKVKGLLVRLVRVKDASKASALEVTAGGKLFNVVVDNEKTGKDLLQRGGLKKRVTIIPLNKIARNCISPEVVKKAQELVGAENVETALSLVGFDKDVEAAMEFAFGSTFICKDNKTAEKVTFHRDIRKKSVTIQGDVFDPAGTLTGGSAPSSGSILNRLQELNALEQELRSAQTRFTELTSQHGKLVSAEEGAEELSAQREVVAHELGLLQAQAEQTSFAQATSEAEELNKAMEEQEAAAAKAKADKAVQVKKASELEKSIKDFEGEKKKKLQSMEQSIVQGKKDAAAAQKGAAQAQQDKDRAQLEMEDMRVELAGLEETIAGAEAQLGEVRAEAEALQKVVAVHKEAYDAANQELNDEKKKVQTADKQISTLKQQHAQLTKQASDIGLEMKKLQHKISRMLTDKKESSIRVVALLKKHEWIVSEKQFFGKANTDYDFKAVSPKTATARLAALKGEQEELSKKINKKVMGMFEKAEQEYQDLMKKRNIIIKDKSKIEEVIAELDHKKNETLQTTYDKVTKDFGSIFSALLPGTSAKLSPPEGGTVLDGLEIRVAFGKVWKDSLSELSGGQRSLLALSLILALLLFKPAPMYILDEIDAALDLSHTQNIGQMLKKHFSQSQFIVVSLKEGMFSNANVLFRTKFVDGVSAVTRHVGAGAAR
jgi:structural maintenance of chromosome 2